MDTKALTDAMKEKAGAPPGEAEQEALLVRLRGDGFRVLPNVVKGKSGVEHEFGVVARDPSGVLHGYVFAPQPDDKTILGLYEKQLDTGNKVHVVHKAEAGSLAARRAKEYGVELVKLQSLRPATQKSQGGTGQRAFY